MTPHSSASVTCWLAGLKSGRTDAADLIWHRYVEALVRRARRKLGRGARRVADEEDVVLSAFNGFLQGVADGRFLKLDNRDDLWQVLVMLTERRAIAMRRRAGAQKRGYGNVRGESIYAIQQPGGSHRAGLDQEPGAAASPAFAAELNEQLRRLLDGLADDVQRRLALGKLHGQTNEELARELGISLRSVERKLGIIRDKWRGELS